MIEDIAELRAHHIAVSVAVGAVQGFIEDMLKRQVVEGDRCRCEFCNTLVRAQNIADDLLSTIAVLNLEMVRAIGEDQIATAHTRLHGKRRSKGVGKSRKRS